MVPGPEQIPNAQKEMGTNHSRDEAALSSQAGGQQDGLTTSTSQQENGSRGRNKSLITDYFPSVPSQDKAVRATINSLPEIVLAAATASIAPPRKSLYAHEVNNFQDGHRIYRRPGGNLPLSDINKWEDVTGGQGVYMVRAVWGDSTEYKWYYERDVHQFPKEELCRLVRKKKPKRRGLTEIYAIHDHSWVDGQLFVTVEWVGDMETTLEPAMAMAAFVSGIMKAYWDANGGRPISPEET